MWVRGACTIISIATYSLVVIYLYNNLYAQSHLPSTPLHSSCIGNQAFLPIKHLSSSLEQPQAKESARNAFVSILSTKTDLLQTLILGYTIRQHHPKHPMILLHIDHELRNQTIRCALQTIGWTLISVPRSSSSVPLWFMFWNLTQYQAVIYLPSNSMVLNDLSHLHELVAEPNRTGFALASINQHWSLDQAPTDVLVLHPCQQIFNELQQRYLLTHAYGNRSDTAASLHFQQLQLPAMYNISLNLAPSLWPRRRADWKIIQADLHHLLRTNTSMTDQYQLIYDLVHQLYRDFQEEKNRLVFCKLSLWKETSCYPQVWSLQWGSDVQMRLALANRKTFS